MTIGLTYDADTGELDIELAADLSLADADPLVTAVIISLHTDAQVTLDDGTSVGGSWMDAYPDVPGDVGGSRLWHILRNGVTAETAAQCQEAADECLAWLLREKLVRSIDATATRAAGGRIDIAIDVVRLSGEVLRV